jgi:hypothetical protein
MKTPGLILSGLLAFSVAHAQSVQLPKFCTVSTETQTLQMTADEKKEYEDFENFTQEYTQKSTDDNACYVIPVVFHVYGATQGGYAVNEAVINDALMKLNQDFHGLNADFGTVHNHFTGIRSTMPDITFALAQLDPDGDPTTGIVYHPVTSGFGNGNGYDAAISSDAWDNFRYMNIYVMNDLYNDGVTNNSGVAWYPNTGMSNDNTARIVYNGAYLGYNCNSWEPEFASTLTHEYGHWLNLIHTFEGGCTSPNDQVADTPPCDYASDNYNCHPNPNSSGPLNCQGNIINAENYMDYAGATGCYKMFTLGQTARMYAALQHPSRWSLWQPVNLVVTGLSALCNTTGLDESGGAVFSVYPNPSSGIFNVRTIGNDAAFYLSVTDELGKEIYNSLPQTGTQQVLVDLSAQPAGIYFLSIRQQNSTKTYKLIRK